MPKQMVTDKDIILTTTKQAKDMGSSRFFVGASGEIFSEELFEMVCNIVTEVRKFSPETCLTMDMLRRRTGRKIQSSRPRLL